LLVGVLSLAMILPGGLIILMLSTTCACVMTWGAWRILQHYDTELKEGFNS
jgi:hypothetical protein